MYSSGGGQIQLLWLGEEEALQMSIRKWTLKSLDFKIYFENKEIYGAPKIYKIRIGRGETSSLKRVQKLMWELGLRSIIMKKYKTDKQANVGP